MFNGTAGYDHQRLRPTVCLPKALPRRRTRFLPIFLAVLGSFFVNTNRLWLLAKRPNGLVTRENFDYVEIPIPEPAEGHVLVRNLFLSFDPTQRGWMEDRESYLPPVAIGAPESPTPPGSYAVTKMDPQPVYHKKGKVIAPGPSNPVDLRYVAYVQIGTGKYAIHGTAWPN